MISVATPAISSLFRPVPTIASRVGACRKASVVVEACAPMPVLDPGSGRSLGGVIRLRPVSSSELHILPFTGKRYTIDL
jgi:hypothetical protein